MKILNQLETKYADLLREWCRKQKLAETTYSSYVKGRLEKWYRMGSNLQSIKLGYAKVFKCTDAPGWITACGDKYLPGWNSLLVCGGPTTIDWHRDHGHFFGPAVMINLGEAKYSEAERHAAISAGSSPRAQSHDLKDGMIVLIDTKLPHKSEQVSPERFNLTFRTIRPEFL